MSGLNLGALHEGDLLQGLSADERQVLDLRAHDANVRMAWALAPLFLLFALVLVWLDIKRIDAGKFRQSSLYTWLAVGHVAYGLACLPVMLMGLRERLSRRLMVATMRVHIVAVMASFLALGFLGILERGSLALVAVAMLFGNLVYQVPSKLRAGFNVVALLSCGALLLDPMDDEVGRLVRSAEALALVLASSIAGGLHHRQRIASLLAEHRLTQMAMLDTLTGVASRRRLEDAMRQQLAAVARGRHMSLVVLDLDYFKSINDRHGHDTGDEVLRAVARVLQKGARLVDVIGRWGGEEFMVVCTDTAVDGAAVLADRLAHALRETSFPVVDRVTASFGVAQAVTGDSERDLVDRADRALYKAKEAGRDRVVVAPPPVERAGASVA